MDLPVLALLKTVFVDETESRCQLIADASAPAEEGRCYLSLFSKWEQGATEKLWHREAEKYIICTSDDEELFHCYTEGKARQWLLK